MSVFSANAAAGALLRPGTEVVAYWYPGHSFVLERSPDEGETVPVYTADPLGVAP
jgi:spermidine/putrescine transport system ATP-binding protein